ncbi:accessory Sec system translocase SecA2 [Paenibacillus donghaensis]|uniref:Protein translocase subunit SecA n=2 Tax=Paenibacillus donghaensis TaxID=414771 RepID=A0A2Z2KJ78_9BACL|nr:accessory Sec system translocase SecA2 [Paenibacillus donghaensis]
MSRGQRYLAGKLNTAMNQFRLNPYAKTIQAVKAQHAEAWSEQELKSRSARLRQQAQGGAALSGLLVEAAALAAEAVWRVQGIRLRDTQLAAGMAMADGQIAEMQTGEGKTLAAVLPLYLRALAGRGAQVWTFNDYLARRDAAVMGPVFDYLGLVTGCIQEEQSWAERRQAYLADITYLTAHQAGFDYLKDSLVLDMGELLQRPFHFVLVDEADSILIDEARIPLVLAGAAEVSRSGCAEMARLAASLRLNQDYRQDEHGRNVYLTDAGIEQAEARLGCANLYDSGNQEQLARLHHALHAQALLHRDLDYIVREGQVLLIDEFTGRIADKRQWPDGLQAAVEAKEGLNIQGGGMVRSSITLQHLLSLYPHFCGMTATARASAEELLNTYGLRVAIIPPYKPCVRIDEAHLVFMHKEAKLNAVVKEIAAQHRTGRPVLVGTASVEESEHVAARLQSMDITCQVLNAQQDAREAELILGAGKLDAVTVSTNMAGRGVDILLGGGDPAKHQAVCALGGLLVIGTSLHESSRVDQQLRGRAGRQGDPGASRYMISLDDETLQRYGIGAELPEAYHGLRQVEPLESAAIRRLITHIQRVAEGQNVEIKKTLNKYSDLIEQQRRIMLSKRTSVLKGTVKTELLSRVDQELYGRLCSVYGEATVLAAERQLLLAKTDHCWSAYMDHMFAVREAIHLESVGNKNPLDVYNEQAIEAFAKLEEQVQRAVLEAFAGVSLEQPHLSFSPEALSVPSATWTYMIDDSFLASRVNLF